MQNENIAEFDVDCRHHLWPEEELTCTLKFASMIKADKMNKVHWFSIRLYASNLAQCFSRQIFQEKKKNSKSYMHLSLFNKMLFSKSLLMLHNGSFSFIL